MTIALLVVHYALMFAGVAYVALHRVVVRRKLRIKVRQRLLVPANLSELLPCHWQWVHVACALRHLSRCGAIFSGNHHAIPTTYALVLHRFDCMITRASVQVIACHMLLAACCCPILIALLVSLPIKPSGLPYQCSGADWRRVACVAAVLWLRAGQLPELPGRVVPAVLVPAVRAVPGALAASLILHLIPPALSLFPGNSERC